MDKVELLEGIIVTPLKIIENSKGDIFHGMKNIDPGYKEFGEAYFSTVLPGHIKAWKKHLRMTLNLIVPVGKVRFVLFDDREESSTKGKFMDLSLSKSNYQRLTIPPNVWFGFQGKGFTHNLVLNIANNIHDPDEQINIDFKVINYNW
jgi:dTDP-4-dehydrorhamnose 3,5-epimerase